jgi:hypothetical protein
MNGWRVGEGEELVGEFMRKTDLYPGRRDRRDVAHLKGKPLKLPFFRF